MEITKSRLCGVPLLRVAGDIDHFTSPALLGAANNAMDPESPIILLDLKACPFLDSGGMSVLFSILAKVKSRLGWLGVIAPSQDVHRLLETVALTTDHDFRVFANMDGAKRQLQLEGLGN